MHATRFLARPLSCVRARSLSRPLSLSLALSRSLSLPPALYQTLSLSRSLPFSFPLLALAPLRNPPSRAFSLACERAFSLALSRLPPHAVHTLTRHSSLTRALSLW